VTRMRSRVCCRAHFADHQFWCVRFWRFLGVFEPCARAAMVFAALAARPNQAKPKPWPPGTVAPSATLPAPTDNVQALMMVLDVEWDARERAKGELDRKPNRINFTNMGFKETHPLKLVWQSGEVFIESIDKCLYWYTGRGNEKSRFSRIETVRQFLALRTLFGISPST
jgi:hypothetical protein